MRKSLQKRSATHPNYFRSKMSTIEKWYLTSRIQLFRLFCDHTTSMRQTSDTIGKIHVMLVLNHYRFRSRVLHFLNILTLYHERVIEGENQIFTDDDIPVASSDFFSLR